MAICKLNIIINDDRPDFRLFRTFLWGDEHRIDSDGDSYNPASRTWTHLYMGSRELENHSFEIYKTTEDPLTFEVVSENELLLKRVAYFLAMETNGQICWMDNKLYSYSFMTDKLGSDFNLPEAIKRVEQSIWRESSLYNPYPNL